MFELVFNSFASANIDKDDLLVVQKISGNTGSKIDITGCLFYHGNQFVGILEGSEENVKEYFSKIERDNKDRNISVLAKGPTKERQFDQWNMISAKGPKNGVVGPRDGLLVQNVLGLAQLTEKRTYESRVFWHTVKRIIRETARQRAKQNDEDDL